MSYERTYIVGIKYRGPGSAMSYERTCIIGIKYRGSGSENARRKSWRKEKRV